MEWERMRIHFDIICHREGLEEQILTSFTGLKTLTVVWNDVRSDLMAFKLPLPPTFETLHLDIQTERVVQRFMSASGETLNKWEKLDFETEINRVQEKLVQDAEEAMARGERQPRKKQNEPRWPSKENVLNTFCDFFHFRKKSKFWAR